MPSSSTARWWNGTVPRVSAHSANFKFQREGNSPLLTLSGHLDASGVESFWRDCIKLVRSVPAGGEIRVDLGGVEYLDGAGVGLLLDLRRQSAGHVAFLNLPAKYQSLLAPLETVRLPDDFEPPDRRENMPVYLGRLTVQLLGDLREQVIFVGRLVVWSARALVRPDLVRWGETWRVFQQVGNNAFLIVCMIGFLMGMIMAFQSAMPLQQFGVDIFTVNLVALAMLRELGAIMTAIVVAGRSGTAFAAEIGTMKVNEEINALTTMGLDPTRFLVFPRVLAGVLATPLLTIYANLAGIAGGLFVVWTLGYSWAAMLTQLTGAVHVEDVLTGIIKSVVFGFLIAAVGCLRGLQTGSGALSVGISTTRAVVSSIVLIILTDGIFAVVFYAIGF